MWIEFGRMVEEGRVNLGPVGNDEVLLQQLVTRKVRTNGKGKLTLEGKDELRARGINSPDRADALVLAFCGGGGKRIQRRIWAVWFLWLQRCHRRTRCVWFVGLFWMVWNLWCLS